MANRERGEVALTVGDNEYTLKLSMNAAVTLEGKLKKKMSALLNEASELDFTIIREIVFMLLQKYHAAEFKTVTAVGDFIDEAGGIKMFFDTLSEIAKVNTPTEEGSERPPQAQAGTSEPST